MVFAIRGDVAGPLSQSFHITNEQMGLVFSPAFWAFTIAIFISGNLVDVVGMRRLHILSAVGFIAGVALVVLAPRPDRAGRVAVRSHRYDAAVRRLFHAGALAWSRRRGHQSADGLALSATRKRRRITSVHAWWPAGLIIGGLLAVLMTNLGIGWQLKLSLILVPAVDLSRDGAVGQPIRRPSA